MRWRQFEYVCTADITKMYRQILVDTRDCDFQRILWRAHPSQPVQDFQLLTVTYGTTSAPFLALRVLQQLTADEGTSFPLAAPVLQHQTYVDDCLFGACTEEAAIATRVQLIALLQRGGFQLHKWAANKRELLGDITDSDRNSTSRDIRTDEHHKVLGLAWNSTSDSFRFKFTRPTDAPSTKRSVLSVIARLFDPLGWLTPVVISAKIFIQRLWLLNCDWDDELPVDIADEWSRLWKSLPTVDTISIPRWTANRPTTAKLELHGFADASTKAYAAVVYLRALSPDGAVSMSLLIAKSKVAPLRVVSVPRLELCAAVLVARLIHFTRHALQIPSLPAFCWSDSTVTLEWISQPPARWKTFVANRVATIHELNKDVEWRHVPTLDNPADCASRGLTAPELRDHRLWWSGPEWLWTADTSWPSPSSPSILTQESLAESKPLMVSTGTMSTPWDLPSRFSSWIKLIRVTALVMRYTTILRRRRDGSQPLMSRIDELSMARLFWLKTIQQESFPAEYARLANAESLPSSSALLSLAPYLDDSGIIRIRGRLRQSDLPDSSKHPMVLKSHPLVKLLVRHLHLHLMHGGPRLLLARVRQEYWLLRPRPLIRAVIYQCIACTRESAKVSEQLMGDLPAFRVTPSVRPFVHTGVDYAGPILVRSAPGRGHKAHKAYISVFICMVTKALHLELVSDYSTAAFLAAYRRFVSRRGVPSNMYSDNGTTFRGADRDLAASFRHATRDSSLTNGSADEGVVWHYIPPAAPHFGGLWEAAVKSMKHHLRRCIGSHTLTFEEMTTLLCRIEACLNSRPLTATSDNIDDYQVLTPGHFLIGTALVSPPEPSVLSITENRLSRWQMIQRLHESVWLAWRRDYLHTLQQRPRWRIRHTLARCGQLVLLKDAGRPPSQWTLGRIIKCHPGDDGIVRVVTVRTSHAEYKRPITKLCFLPIDVNHADGTRERSEGGTQQP